MRKKSIGQKIDTMILWRPLLTDNKLQMTQKFTFYIEQLYIVLLL